MGKKRLAAALLSVMLLFSCSFVPAAAAESPSCDAVIARSTGRLNHRLLSGITPITSALPFAKGDTITFDCTYSPKSASLDFGIIDSDGVFHYLECTSGSIYKSIKIDEADRYTLAIRNNASYAVTVTGTVRY